MINGHHVQKFMNWHFLILILVISTGFQIAHAESVQISTSKKIYNYGDYLSITIIVSENVGKNAIMHIIDSGGTKSSAIPIKIQNLNTTITTPTPFNSEVFKEGKYKIEIEYEGAESSTEFQIVDSGNIVMPFGSTTIVPQWSNGKISDYLFLKFLVEKKIIVVSDSQTITEKTNIPGWFKTNGHWWSERKITDDEFVRGLQYLVNQRLVNIY